MVTTRAIQKDDAALDRLFKLLPAEVTAVYVSIRTLVEASSYQDRLTFLLIAAVIMAVLSMIYVARFKDVSNRLHRLLYGGTFLLWAIALDATKIDEQFLSNSQGFSLAIGIASLIWTFLIQLAIPTNKLTS